MPQSGVLVQSGGGNVTVQNCIFSNILFSSFLTDSQTSIFHFNVDMTGPVATTSFFLNFVNILFLSDEFVTRGFNFNYGLLNIQFSGLNVTNCTLFNDLLLFNGAQLTIDFEEFLFFWGIISVKFEKKNLYLIYLNFTRTRKFNWDRGIFFIINF